MRIIAGTAKGRVLKSLRGRALRPTSDRMRESVFAVLAHELEGANFLDLYAGAGTVGLEALSRGAARAVFVESHRPAGRVIRENAGRCGFAERIRVIMASVGRGLALLRRDNASFDIVFIDPPYGRGELGGAMARLAQWPELLRPTGLVVVQRSRHEDPGEQVGDFVRSRSMRYGDTVIDLYRRGQHHGAQRQDASP
ncbi:MAG: 16S rRNA (guanine(966)-N(2))-methyltransferase RsmD [Armatimonadetes bacterium]|nr:16S rRNA (guanine(966)-N(2))-methyltransferase RsmD [Armatimonadota bacterium]